VALALVLSVGTASIMGEIPSASADDWPIIIIVDNK
jgi:hypothetical protein